ncbi:MAG: heat-shock protein, partial [Idiomarina sp.]|nr:heat-shock protein [Idiomarina sp.]
MNNIDLTPLYRSSIGFDRLASMLDSALRSDTSSGGYPPYNIEALGENRYGITIAVAGFEQSELDIQVERGVLTVR